VSGLGGSWWVADQATGKVRRADIPAGTAWDDDTIVKELIEFGADPDNVRALSRSTGVAKSRTLHISETTSPWPLCDKHRDLADSALKMIVGDLEVDAEDPRVAKALLERAERALEEFFWLQDDE
jgi:hypothetical protein